MIVSSQHNQKKKKKAGNKKGQSILYFAGTGNETKAGI
jgi:hypothetical protein